MNEKSLEEFIDRYVPYFARAEQLRDVYCTGCRKKIAVSYDSLFLPDTKKEVIIFCNKDCYILFLENIRTDIKGWVKQ
ncbi:MAG: hypothetical protein ACYDAO_04415 [Thermoplasmataceae archaeon]